MPKTGLRAAMNYHDSNVGSLPYTPLKFTDEKPRVRVRILAHASPDLDEKTQQPIIVEGERYIQSIFRHSKWGSNNNKIIDERCAVDEDTADPGKCPLCRVNAPRVMKTYVPVRERNDEQRDRVKWWVIGREALQSLISVTDEIRDNDLTATDIIIKRSGSKKTTKYDLFPQESSYTKGGLGPDERALEFPELDEMLPIKSDDELEKLAVAFERATNATKTGADEELEEVPF